MEIDKHMRKVIDHLWGPTGSVILHIIIVILLIKLLVFKHQSDANVTVQMVEMEMVDIDKLDEVLDELEDVNEMEDIEPPLEDAPPDPSQFEDTPEMDITELEVDTNFDGPLVLKDLFASRSSSGRRDGLNKYSDKWGRYTEPAVLLALDWLKEHQIKDGNRAGSWKPEGKFKNEEHYVAMAGIGLLAFLAHGETTGSEKYGETVELAIKYLRTRQEETGSNGAFCRLNQHGVYAHGIATYAMSEAYALTRIPYLEEVMNGAVRKIVRGQQAGGGWDYKYSKGGRRDTSVASWQIQALKAAFMAGCEVDGLKNAIKKASKDLKTNYMESGDFRYSNSRKSQCSTSMGALCLQLIGHGRDDQVLGAIKNMKDEQCKWEPNQGTWAMYKWYYLTQAKFHSGGNTWKQWNNDFAPAYIENQSKDGHWDPPTMVKKGHSERVVGPAFTTSLGALTLQVYYRFLPTYKEGALKKIEIDVDEDVIDEDIIIDII